MKNFLILICLLAGLSPFTTYGQSSCFTSQSTFTGLVNSLNNGTQCALPFYNQGCVGLQTEASQVAFGPSSSSNYFEECDYACTDDFPGPYSPTLQVQLFEKAVNLAAPFAPTCTETGLPMVIVNIEFSEDPCFTCNGDFIDFIVTYACCEVADDCNANFTIEQSKTDCDIYLTNNSTASSINDCGDCDNPAGITSVTWQVYEYTSTFPAPSVSIWLTSNSWNFSFDPDDAPNNPISFRICLTIEDCLGCTSTTCEDIFFFANCNSTEYTSNEDQFSEFKLLQSTQKKVSVFPNPGNDQVNIQLQDADWEKGNSTIEIYGLQGQLLKSVDQIDSSSQTVDVSSLVPGMYIITVNTDGERIHTEKLIIKR